MLLFKFPFSNVFITVCSFLVLLAPAVEGSLQEETMNELQTRFSIFQDFKAVLMYFSEAFLTGAKFGKENLEGEKPLVMPEKFVHILEQVEVSGDRRLEPLRAFKKQLQAGILIGRKIQTLSSDFSPAKRNSVDMMIKSAKSIQVLVLKSIFDNDGIIIPSGWIDHATTMVIKPAVEAGFFNLAYINSGQGLRHHYTGPDPNNVYPNLSRLWIEFKNIPQEEIFNSETAWLVYALAAIENSDFAVRINFALSDGKESLPNYFYGSLLANFKSYIVVPQGAEISDRLVPEQQSGSCTMSSLMGALLYYSDSLAIFHLYRLKLGHVFLKTFLERLDPIIEGISRDEDDLKFLSILKDGFFSGGSNHFYGLIRALANQQLQYLEHKFPKEFRHAGLIGKGRSTWITNKKATAIEILSGNESAKIDLQMTIKLAKLVHEMASKFQFRPETTHIRDLSEIHEAFSSKEIYMEQRFRNPILDAVEGLQFTVADGGNIYQNLLAGKPELLEIETIPINNFEEFYRRFTELFDKEDFQKEVYFLRFLDIFKGLRAGVRGWELIHNYTIKDELLYLQQSCKLVAFRFVNLANSYKKNDLRKATMDEITLLGHLQLLTWNLFKALHKLDFTTGNEEIDWERLAPPQTIQSALLEYRKDPYTGSFLISGSMSILPIKSFNSVSNFRLYQQFFNDSQTELIDLPAEESGIFAFPGPESGQAHSDYVVDLSESTFQDRMKNDNFRKIMESYTRIPEIEDFWNNLKRDDPQWAESELSEDYAKYLIVMYKGQELLLQKLQHFYNLMYTLQYLRLGVKMGGIIIISSLLARNIDFWINLESNSIKYPNVSACSRRRRDISHYQCATFRLRPANKIRGTNSVSDLFYYMRHTYAHPKEIGFTDVDTWFNYIKNAKSSKIFDSSYFQYITDHLLNIPKYLQYSAVRVLLFDENKARKIVLELIKLIRNTLKDLDEEAKIMTLSRRENIIRRSVNISVIVTRFISRMDYEFKDSIDSVDWASLLARLYNTLERYSYLNSPISKLSDSDVSRLNFALSHMCYTHLSDPENFIKSVQLGFKCPYRRNRKTLARFHWFMAKMNYCLSTDNMISDDQFKYGGFPGSPLDQEEIGFFEWLLKKKFLSHYLRIDYSYAFKYEAEGYVVEIIANLQDSPQIRLLINLATGAIVENGHMLAKKSPFILSPEFQKYFPTQSHLFLSSKGKAFMFSGVPVFSLPTFKGSNYLMVQCVDKLYGTDAVKFWLLRKWGNDWYIWSPYPCLSPLNYNWAGNPITEFKKHRQDTNDVEMIIFDDIAKDPIVKVTKNRLNSLVSYRLSIPGLTDEVSGKIIKSVDVDYLELHLNAFAEEGITVARQASDGILIVAYNSYRLPDDPTRPFVLISSPDDNVIHVRNLQGMEICKDQRIGMDGSGLPGSLVSTIDGKKILLLPFAELLGRSVDFDTANNQIRSYITIEKIPIVEVPSKEPIGDYFAVPAPQSRMHKLLLAYYMILAQRYDSARKILHPSRSFLHNEVFSEEELKTIIWILRIDMEAPEFKALRLFIYSHFLINEAKFSFKYDQLLAKAVEEVKYNDPASIFERHIMTIRELPEKYYVFKVFPEILVKGSTLSKAFFEFDRIGGSKMLEKTSEIPFFPKYGIDYQAKNEFGTRQSLESLLHLMISPLNLEIKMMKNLLVRSKSHQKFDKSFEMAVFCYILKPELWTEFKNLLVNDRTNFKLNRDSWIALFDSTILQCQHQSIMTTQSQFNYQSQFEGASLEHLSKCTNPLLIRDTMIKDLGVTQDYDGVIKYHTITIDTKNERDAMLKFKNILMARIRSSGSDNASEEGFSFDIKLDESSRPVLTSLSNSISSYISEKGANHLASLDLHNEELEELRKLNQTLIDRITELKKLQKTLTESLTSISATDPQSLIAQSLESIFSMMHRRKEKTFSDLYACYLRNSSSCVQKKFPQLDLVECERVKETAVLFFSHQILLDYLEMVQKSTAAFSTSNSVPVDDLLIFCDELEKISDFNDRIQNPVIMNFEFRSKKYRLKSEQVKDIGLLTEKEEEPKGNFKSVVIQRMMAAGKTLVLGTISVVMKALKGDGKLSILVPPSSLYQSNTTAMQYRTYQYFKKKGNNFSFQRLPLATNEELGRRVSAYLENVIQIINQTIKSRSYLVLSPDHLQSFLNSYIEAIENAKLLCVGENSQQYLKILKYFATIYQIFKTKTSIILDEIDMTMDPKKELNFPTDETESYNMTAVAMLADIFEFMLFDKHIQEAGLKIHSNNQAALTTENYIKCRAIVLGYIERQLEVKTSMWRKFVPKSAKDDVMAFLLAENMSYDINSFYEEGQEIMAKALIIVKTQLYLHLQEFFGGTVNQNYGSAGPLRPQIKYAVPYVAANTPSAGSVFADRWETLIKTILMISASPCSIETAKSVIEYVNNKIMEEYSDKTGLDIRTLPTFLNMKMVLPDGFDIMELDENDFVHVEKVRKGLAQRSPAAIRIIYGYFINEVLYKMTFPVEQITSNALHLTHMFASVQGYSGTIDNVNILPHRVVSEAAIDHDKNEKNNGGIALKLIKDSDDTIIPELGDDSLALSANEMMDRFLDLFEASEQFPIHQVSAIIDTGAFFKNFTNRQVSEAILHYFKGTIKTVLYYNETSNQLEFIRGTFNTDDISFTVGFLETTDPDDIERTTQTIIEERFTFYDQRHITGSDILQPKNGHAIMSAGPRVLLRDILQGTLRMRQFMTSQKVHLVISESVRKLYCSKIGKEKESLGVSDILTLGALNEDEKQKHENERLAFGKIDAEIRSFVLDEISKRLILSADRIKVKQVTKIYDSSRDLFVRSIREDPLSWLVDRELQSTADVLEQHVAYRLKKLSPLLISSLSKSSRYHNFTKQLELMYKSEHKTETYSLLNYLNNEIHVRLDNSIGSEVLIQNQTQTLTLMDLDLDQMVEQIDGDFVDKDYTFDLLNEPCLTKGDCVYSEVNDFFNVKTIFKSQPDSKNDLVKSILLTDASEIGVTTDLIQLYEIPANNENKFPIFSKYNMEGTHFLVFTLPDRLNQPKVILLSPRHAAEVFKSLKKPELRNYNFWLCDLSGDVIISKTNLASPDKNIFKLEELKPKLKSLIFDLLIFNGSLPQILANSMLRRLYENKWMTGTHSQARATFLRLRMKVLQEKSSKIFEDDDNDYVKLKIYSTGNFLAEKKVSRTDGFSKSAIDSVIQDGFFPNITAETALHVEESISASANLDQYINEIFEPITNGAEFYNDESCLNLQVLEPDTTFAEDEIVEIDNLDNMNECSDDEYSQSSEVSDHESSEVSDDTDHESSEVSDDTDDESSEVSDYESTEVSDDTDDESSEADATYYDSSEVSDHKHDKLGQGLEQKKKKVPIVDSSTNFVYLLTFLIPLIIFFMVSCVIYFIFLRAKSHADDDEDEEDYEDEDLESGKSNVSTD